MAFTSKRTTELDELTSIASDDYYVIVDVSDSTEGIPGKTKKVSHQTLADAVGGVGSIDASNITSGTLADARLTSNVTLEGNTFNGANQLVKLDGSERYPSKNGSQITNINATNITLGEINETLIPITIPRIKKIVIPLATATTENITNDESNRLFVCRHLSGTVIFNLDISIEPGSYFTIINTGTGDIQINSSGDIIGPSAVGNVSLIGRSPGSRRVEIICIDPAQFVISGDLLP